MSTGRAAGGGGSGGSSPGGRGRARKPGTKPSGPAKLQEKLAAKAAKQARIAEKATRRRDRLEAISDRFGGTDIWTRVPPGARQPRFTRDAIAATAVHIADTEGIDALSMRRLAAELGAGTMTLYHYVHTKDELLALVTDAVMAEVVLPDDVALPADWRAAITLVAGRSRAALERHFWMLDIREDPSFGPNGVRHFDQTLEALRTLDVAFEDKMDVALLVDEYVFGYVLHSRFAVPDEPTRSRQMLAYVERLLATGRYPQLASLVRTLGLQTAWEQMEARATDPDRFDRNLERLLDGIQRDLESR